MKQDTNNPPSASPVDDLFARRLGQHSVVPDKAVWGRLQSKMAGKQEVRVLAFWQNPVLHRYAAAACVSALLLAGGWLLLRPTAGTTTRQNQMVMSGSETDGSMADSQTVIKQNRKPQSRYEADLATGLQPKQTDFSDLKEQATPTAKMDHWLNRNSLKSAWP